MPGDGVAWPQTLVEAKSFVIDRVGVTEVEFAKGCDPVQFDVVTGATPPSISPLGEMHGPLLVADVGTAQQYWGTPCTEPTSTTSPTTTTSSTTPSTTTSTTSTTTTSIVPATTTVVETAGNGSVTSTTAAAAVAGQTAVRGTATQRSGSGSGDADPGVLGSALAVTGSSAALVLLAGAAQVAVGAALIVTARRAVR